MRLSSLVICACLLRAALASADPHPMTSGATPAPTTDTQVAMTEETLTIAMDLRSAAVHAAVTLENRGAATRLQVGFPCATGEDAGSIDVPCKVPLTVTINGKKVAARKQKTGKAQQHWVWPLALDAGEKAALSVRYRAPLINDRYSVPASGMGSFTYRLTTGARWAGPIGKLQITVDHLHEPLLFVSPPGYQREPGRLTWTLADHEPGVEVILIPHPIAGGRLAQSLVGKGRGKGADTVRARLAAGDYAKADVDAALAHLRDAGDWGDGWLGTISRVGGFPTPSKEQAAVVIAESIKVLEGLAARAKR